MGLSAASSYIYRRGPSGGNSTVEKQSLRIQSNNDGKCNLVESQHRRKYRLSSFGLRLRRKQRMAMSGRSYAMRSDDNELQPSIRSFFFTLQVRRQMVKKTATSGLRKQQRKILVLRRLLRRNYGEPDGVNG
nr:hypothetical protein Iba_chr06aCG15430 [Ipomoea batatas]